MKRKIEYDYIHIVSVGTVVNVYEFDGYINFDIRSTEYEKNNEIFSICKCKATTDIINAELIEEGNRICVMGCADNYINADGSVAMFCKVANVYVDEVEED